MKTLLHLKAEKQENLNMDKALKIIKTINKSIEANKEITGDLNTLYLNNHGLYFETFKVAYESLGEHWLQSEENLRYYTENCNNIAVILIVNGQETAKITLNTEDNIIMDKNEFLEFKSGKEKAAVSICE